MMDGRNIKMNKEMVREYDVQCISQNEQKWY